MLAYRHGFHAGNHGDVLKHLVLIQVLDHLGSKDTPLRYVDTHAGAGIYLLADRFAQTTGEYAEGIGRLWDRQESPPAVARYLELIRRFNPEGGLAQYPGSPAIAQALLHPQDQMRLFELHRSDLDLLVGHFGRTPRTQVTLADGFEALRSQVPPSSRRALVLVDPSYELPADYGRVVACVRDAMTRFAQGVYLVWYPIVRRSVSAQLPGRLARIARDAPKGWLHASLSVAEPDEQGFGMTGSGVFVINPPHTLRPALEAALPWLRDALARTPRARFLLEHDQQARDEAGPRDGVASARRATLPKGRHVHARTPR